MTAKPRPRPRLVACRHPRAERECVQMGFADDMHILWCRLCGALQRQTKIYGKRWRLPARTRSTARGKR